MHNREPPPVEILEKLTAKGGDILNRTVETFQPPQKGSTMNGTSDSESEEATTPKDEKMDIDDPGSGTGRTTRGIFLPNLVSLVCVMHIHACPRSPPAAATKSPLPTRYHVITTNATQLWKFQITRTSFCNHGNSKS